MTTSGHFLSFYLVWTGSWLLHHSGSSWSSLHCALWPRRLSVEVPGSDRITDVFMNLVMPKYICLYFQSWCHTQTYIHASTHAGAEVSSFTKATMVSLPQNLLHHFLGLLNRKNMVITVHSNWAAASYLNEMILCMYLHFVGISNNS